MAALNFTELSKPIAEDGPCGPDLEDDTDFMNVTARIEVALPTAYFRRDDEGQQVAFDRSSIEFPAAFALIEPGEPLPVPDPGLRGERDLGWMLLDIDHGGGQSRFFRAVMRDGVIEVPAAHAEGTVA